MNLSSFGRTVCHEVLLLSFTRFSLLRQQVAGFQSSKAEWYLVPHDGYVMLRRPPPDEAQRKSDRVVRMT